MLKKCVFLTTSDTEVVLKSYAYYGLDCFSKFDGMFAIAIWDAKNAKLRGENHIFALESDAGGFSPRGFEFEATKSQFAKIQSWSSYFKPYYANHFSQGGSGADIGPLRNGRTVLSGLRPDSQRYFDYHHTAIDTFEAINKRELEMGAGAMTSLIYLVDQFGI